ncbi:capsule biosynthesis protein [Rhodovulum viride]|uniref:Capsule biosynthesis protein n=2 Tax=Rhodovulum viride TaxID=1231134 RepID=A0ABX9DHC6_9RHOB|nr:capsule biosynthesis protein [Rhodovulum viride]
MTTKAKARTFNTRTTEAVLAAAARARAARDGRAVAGSALPPPAPAPASASADRTPLQEIEQIRREGLSGRELRMARRIAQKQGLSITSDFDAVRQLRSRGIHQFSRNAVLNFGEGRPIAPGANDPAAPAGATPGPAKASGSQATPAAPAPAPGPAALTSPAAERASAVSDIQRDIAHRRRRALTMLMARLSVFVVLPAALAGYYFFAVATPMYATLSEFVIQQADAPSGGGGLGSLFQGSSLAMQQDSIAVQSYLQSRDAMLRLDEDQEFRAHFSQPSIDPIQRLRGSGGIEDAYKVYRHAVEIGYDPTEGILKMEVLAADPQVSAAFSKALISYAEDRVDGLTQRLREDQMAGARQSYDAAEERVAVAQNRVLALQEKLGVIDPASETAALMGQINTFEIELRHKRLELQQLLDNATPNAARVSGVEGDIRRLDAMVRELRAVMTEGSSSGGSLARVSAELRIAEADLGNRQLLLQQALEQLETARIEANRQVRYLSLGVSPVAPDKAAYPRAFENTALALLIFGGIYLMISLTLSILREQVSA